jgi:nucleotide-binding universal stress UspA family protein
MSTTTMLHKLRVPAAMLALASIILIPAAFVSADEGGEHEGHRQGHRPPAIAFQIVSIEESSIEGELTLVPEKVTERHFVEEGEEITVYFDEETKFMVDGEEVTIDEFEVGEIAFAIGRVDFNADGSDINDITIEAKAIVDQPMRPRHSFHVGAVVEVDTDANTVLVKGLRPNEDGEENYVLISYDGDTIINEDGEEVDESAISVGDKIHAHGEVNNESEDYFAEIDADKIKLWDETEPRRPGQGHGPRGERPAQAE